MALVTCTECGKEVSGDAASCLNCGAPIAASAIVASQVHGSGEGMPQVQELVPEPGQVALRSVNWGCVILLAVASLTALGFCFAFSRLLRR